MLDLPALGKPTRPTSASSRSSSRRRRCCPGSPRSWKCATRLPADREALPRPPRPPLAATKRAPGVARSASRRLSSSRTMVPTGTGRRRSAPSEPLRLLPWPWVPLRARWCGWKWYSTRVATLGAAADLVVDDPAGDLGEQGVVAATADAGAGVDARAALAHQDRAGGDDLAAE